MFLGLPIAIGFGTVGAMGTIIYYTWNKQDDVSEKDYFGTFSGSLNELESFINSIINPPQNPEFN